MIIHKEKDELSILLIVLIAVCGYLFYKSYSDWRYLVALAVIAPIIFYIQFNVKYFIYDEWLYIKEGLLNYNEVNVFEIAEIKLKNGNVVSIVNKEGNTVEASIRKFDRFVTTLKTINPNIVIT